MLLKHLNPTDWRAEVGETVRRSLIIVTGETGVGKSHLVDEACASLRIPWLDLDSFGKYARTSEGKLRFIVDVIELMKRLDRMETELVLVGYCDNFVEVIEALAPQYALSFYVVSTDYESFRRIHLARYFECKAKGDLDGRSKRWYTRAKCSPSKLERGVNEGVWGHVCTFAYGLQSAGELRLDDPIPSPYSATVRWRNWSDGLAARKPEILTALADACVSLAVVKNIIPVNISSIHGWHRCKGGIKHGR